MSNRMWSHDPQLYTFKKMENELEMTVVLHVIRSSAYISMSYTAEMGSSVRPCTQRHAVNGDIYY